MKARILLAVLLVGALVGVGVLSLRAPPEREAEEASPPRAESPTLTARPSVAPSVNPVARSADVAKNGLRVDVIDSGGTAVAGASVDAVHVKATEYEWGRDPPPALHGVTDARGRCSWADVEAGAYGITASATGAAGASPLVRVAAEGETVAVVRLEAGVAIEGRVTDETGAPLGGARVVADPTRPLRALYSALFELGVLEKAEVAARVGADGRFRLGPLLRGLHDVEVSAPGRVPRVVRGLSAPGTGFEVVLLPGGRVSGTAVLAGEPLPVEVRVWLDAGGPPRRIPVTGSTVPFAIEGLAPRAYTLHARAQGFGHAEIAVLVHAGADAGPVRFLLAPGTPVSGFVRERSSGRAIGGARVDLSYVTYRTGLGSLGWEREQSLTTDANGAWHARLRPGEWAAEVSKEGLVAAEGTPGFVDEKDLFAVGADPVERVLFLSASSPAIEGIVTYEDGEPVAGATVEVIGGDQNPKRERGEGIDVGSEMEAETGKDGRFRIAGLAAHGLYDLVAFGPRGGETRVEGVGFDVGRDTVEIRITVERPLEGGRVSGRIVDEGGTPVAGAMASIGHRAAVTGADGTFSRDRVPAGTHRGRYGAVGYALRVSEPFAVEPGGDVRLPDWVLRRAGLEVRGRVVSAGASPIEGADVTCWFHLSDGHAVTLAGVTDRDGRYALDGPDAGSGTVTVQVRADGYRFAEQRPEVAPQTVADFVLEAFGAVTANLSFQGTPPTRVAVLSHREGGREGIFEVEATLENGRFRCPNVPPGRVRLRLSAPGYAPLVAYADVPEAGEVSLGSPRMTPGGTVAGRVLDRAGNPVGGAQVYLGDALFLYVDTDAAGRWRIEHVTPGTWEATVHVDGPSGPAFPIVVEEGKTTETEFRLP